MKEFKWKVWKNSKTGKYVRGLYTYHWASDRFSVHIHDRCGLRNHDFITCDDNVSWGNYKLVHDQDEIDKALASFKK